jgi:hypothetical protein
MIERSVILGSGDVLSVYEFWRSKELSQPASGIQTSQHSKARPLQNGKSSRPGGPKSGPGLGAVRGGDQARNSAIRSLLRIRALKIGKSQFKFA